MKKGGSPPFFVGNVYFHIDWKMEETREIVLVEDNSNDAELALLAFRKAEIDLKVHTLSDGVEAIAFFVNKNGDVTDNAFSVRAIFLDLKMPKLSGFQVLKELRSHSELATIPIIVLSSSAIDSDIREAYRLGANSYLVKAIDYIEHSEELSKALQYWVAINRTIT